MKKIFRYIFLLLILIPSVSFSQLYYFGRNKVHYDKFDWKILRTEHFNIYYYDEMGEIVEIGAKYAEETYEEYKIIFNNVVTGRIPLIFYNTQLQFQQTNTTPGFIPEGVGGFFEFLKGRVVIPFTGSLHDFKHVIRHELVHVFMTDKIFRVLRDHRIPTDYSPPLWFTEGLAEYISVKQDDQALMVMRDAIINNYFVSLEKIYEIYGTFFMYKEGQSFLEFVAEKYGKEKIPQFIDNIWMDTDFNRVIAYTIGKSFEKIDQEWEFYLKKKYFPLLENKEPPGNTADVLTNWGFNFSPVYHKTDDEDFIYFVANRNGYASLYRLKTGRKENEDEFREPELLLRGEKKEEFEAFHLFQSSIDVSKTGNIAFVTKMGGRDAIHLYSIKDKEVFQNYQWQNLISLASPKFSHDGKMIAFNAIDQKGFSDIFILHLDSDSLERITNDYYDDKQPAFGFDDNQILFSSDRTAGKYEKKYNIFAYDRKTHLINYITYIDANNYSPVLSSDNKTLLFTSDYDGVRNVWMMKTTGKHFTDSVKQVTPFTTSAFDQRFINDSTIIFAGFEKFAFNLYETKINWNDTINCMRMKLDSAVGRWEAAKLIKLSEHEQLSYKKQYTLDYAQSDVTTDPVYGTRGGAIFSLSDLLGDDNYYFLIYNTATVQSEFLKSFNVEIEKISLGQRTNYGYGVFHFSGRRYDITQSEEYFFERSFGGFFLLQFPLSTFQRIDADVSIANSDKEIITGIEERKALLVSNTISWVMDNSIWSPSGPIDGTRARILLGYTGDVKYSNVNYYTFIADIRHYFRLAFPTALAMRASIYYNDGKEARRYFAGGSWDLRGWPLWSIRGEKLWLSSIELRFPLINEINIRFPFFDLGFSSIRGAVFFDAGGAWDTKYIETLGSLGFGFRLNLFGVLVLRYDIGKKIEDNFTQLQPRLFYQFFFGWDF